MMKIKIISADRYEQLINTKLKLQQIVVNKNQKIKELENQIRLLSTQQNINSHMSDLDFPNSNKTERGLFDSERVY